MPQDPAIDSARTRIQRLVEEIAVLSKKELPSEQYFAEFINRAVQACDGRGGAVWLVGQRNAEGKSEFQLAAQVDFESSLFQGDEVQRTLILRAMQECVVQKGAVVLQPRHQQPNEPDAQEQEVAQLQGGQPQGQPQNKTPYSFLHVPLPLKDQVVGVLQVWLQPYVTPQNYAEFAQFLASLATYLEQHLQSRRLGSLVLETQRLQHLLKFTTDVAGSLDPLEISRLAANYGRDLIGCERCSVLWREGVKWRVISISGQEIVEKKSTMVKAMRAFVGAHARAEMVTLSKKELLARHATTLEPVNGEEVVPAAPEVEALNGHTPTDEIDLAYFDVSHVVSGAIAPILDDEKEIVGAYFAESTAEGFFESKDAPAHRITDWLATHTGKSLRAAQDYETLPFVGVAKRVRSSRLALTGPKRGRNVFRLAAIGIFAAAVLLMPWMEGIDGNCLLSPEKHVAIVPEVAGRVEKIFVIEGSRVNEGDPIAQLDKQRLEYELDANQQDRQAKLAESERLRGMGDEAAAQVAFLQARAAEEAEKKLLADIEATTLRSPIAGVVLTKDIEKHSGEFLQAGQPFGEVAAMDSWDLSIEVDERDIGRMEQKLGKHPLAVGYILYSESAHELRGEIKSATQISAAAEPREKHNVFTVTLEEVKIPEEIRSSMRPGLTGRAEIELGRKPLIVLWSSRVWNWLLLRLMW